MWQQKPAWLDWFVVVLVLGYLSMSRSFAQIGWPPIYVGELALVTFFLARPKALVQPLVTGLAHPNALSGVAWCIYLSLAFGALQCLRGLAAGHHRMITIQNLVFHVYALFFFVGVWVGVRHPDGLRKIIRLLAWWQGIYGVAYVLILGQLYSPDRQAGDDIPLFGQPYGAAVCLLGLLAFEKNLRPVLIPFLLNVFVMLAIQVRAAWLGLFVALTLWSSLTGRLGQQAKITAVVGGLLFVGLITDFRIPSTLGRGTEISARHIVARAVGTVSVKAASSLVDSGEAEFYQSTASWRIGWWREIWNMVHETPGRAVFGPGYGYPIWDLHPEELGDKLIRTPHNVFMYALAYTGWVGVVLFYALQLAIARKLWLVYRQTGQLFGFCYWAMIMVWALFDNFFETPFGAIPFYLLVGMAVAPLATDHAATDTPPTPVGDHTSPRDSGGQR